MIKKMSVVFLTALSCHFVWAAPLPLLDLNSPDAAKQVSPSGQDNAEIKVDGGKLAFTMTPTDKNKWPGIAVKPDGGTWDLSPYGYVDVKIKNLGAEDVTVAVRLDDSSKLVNSGAWITAVQKLKANENSTVRLYLTDLTYGRKYILQKPYVSQLLIFGNNLKGATTLVVESIVADGVDGETPKWFLPLKSPADGVLADFAAKTPLKIDHRRTTGEITADGLKVKLSPANGGEVGVMIAPADAKWSLIQFNQVDFYLANPTSEEQKVYCAVNNYANIARKDGVSQEVTLAPGSRQKVTVPFAVEEPWQSRVQSDGKAKTSDAASEKVRTAGDVGGSDLTSDEVTCVVIGSQNNAKTAEVVVEKIVASVKDPEILPDWSGSRPPVPGKWKLTLEENFDGAALNENLWNKKMPWVGLIPGELQRYNPNNIEVKDGMLQLRATREKGYLNNDEKLPFPQGEYTSATVTSYGKWQQAYGYFEARLRTQKAVGVWPAFWGMPFHGTGLEARKIGTTKGGVEVDIFEHPSRFGFYRSNIACHWDGYAADHKKTGISRVYYTPDKDGFVVAGLLWEPGKMTWFVNQKKVGEWESNAVPTVPIYLKFTIQMGSWGGYIVEDDKLKDDRFLIDYVKVWQKEE